ncbi:NADP-dependent oxidoreductase [Virgibacillus xinjiangensis]|uniref:NADP-dependent oxidoreductase n=1 Tax=Virgibacillus xinjiangensis TaxID=393090 RepID=A0ABV7CZD8_9BACI
MTNTNRCILLASRPEGMPDEGNFELVEEGVPEPADGELLIQTIYLSVDPYMRGRMTGVRTYISPFDTGKVLTGGVVGKVVVSRNPNFEKGEMVTGNLPWADYSLSDGKYLRKLDPEAAPVSTALGIAGMPGLTAYFGLLDIGKPQPGETVVISGAAGAVGTVAGQIAKLYGCRVIGIAGSEKKTSYLQQELGFDAVINYRTENMKEAVKQHCPDGVDIYFDNVGGPISDMVMKRINYKARIILCGQISQYNLKQPEQGPRLQGQLIQRSALMQGFIVSDYADRHAEGIKQLGQWLKDGKLQYRENVVNGLENAPQAFIGLFHGENLGKQLVKVADEQ